MWKGLACQVRLAGSYPAVPILLRQFAILDSMALGFLAACQDRAWLADSLFDNGKAFLFASTVNLNSVNLSHTADGLVVGDGWQVIPAIF